MSKAVSLNECMDISLSDSRLEAYLHFHEGFNDIQFTSEQLESFLKEHRVVFGVFTKTVQQISLNPKAFMKSETLIAQGTEPVNGKDGYIQYSMKLIDQNKKPMELEDGSVNYKEVIQLNNVLKGQLIAERALPTDGTPGKTVTGEEIAPKKGKEVRFKMGKNVVVDPGNKAMYAAIDGLIATTDKDKINVFPVYEVNGDVDYNIGNIDFIGTVVIRGNVLNGFRVKAAGDIRVIGGVEGAELDADGSIEITGGIIAANKGYVRAKINVKSSFIQDGNVMAGGDVLVTQSIMHSLIRAGKNVICGGTKGLIVGGTIQAGERVVARTIGNTMSTATTIEVGVVPEMRNELQELRSHLRVSMENLDKTEKALTLLDQLASTGQLPPERLAMRVKLNSTKKQTVQEQSDMRERILEIEKTLEDTTVARIDAVKTIYGGAKIVIGRYTRFIKDPAGRVTFRLSDGEVTMIPYV
ncbi:polymerase [Paenibacillus selenitireducens]|uniref:Polymerase n=1 Tax=Paenibacillus selenitireducens TaxID=1324314 RepID=A0A1T2XCN9_9BACL|nr:FapA family protein [Paenibacillus selenitireducens]OPA77620.1 polymerase [Paenibacillus selenitireducens]